MNSPKSLLITTAFLGLLALAPKAQAQTRNTADSLRAATTQTEGEEEGKKGVLGRFFQEIKEQHHPKHLKKINPKDPYNPLSKEIAEKVGVESIPPSLPEKDTMPTPIDVPAKLSNGTPTPEEILEMYGETAESHYENHIRQGGEVIDMTVYPPNHPNYRPPQITEDGPKDSDE